MSREEKNLSGAMRLFEALSGVDEELLAKVDGEAGTTASSEKKKILSFSGSKVRLAASLAAAASLFLVVGAVWSGAPMLNGQKSAETAAVVVTTESWAGNTMADQADAVVADAEDIAEEVVEEAEEEAVEGAAAGITDGDVADIGDNTSMAANESAGESNDRGKEYGKQNSDEKDVLGREEGAITEYVSSLKTDDRVELSEAQARAVEVLGDYIPTDLPEGYIWETAKAAVNEETGEYDSIFLCWTKGMDSIMITVSVTDVDNISLTDIAKKETYDVSLYDIPYVQTVPEEYRQSFDNPVFAAEDLSLELVQSRMKVIPDSGDTDTPRGNFSVIYPEGILVYFNGDGTAEEIWKMLR